MKSSPEVFNSHRNRLFAIAYRMLGVRMDAEDILQDVYLRWHAADAAALRSPEAWLVTVTTRLCIDRLRAMKAERERYQGPWVPEPLVSSAAPSPEQTAELASDISIAFLMLLERLVPEERAALLLYDVFDVDYDEIARVLGKNPVSCRQIVHRARQRLQGEKPRFTVNPSQHLRLLEEFMQAVDSGDRSQLMALFDHEIKFYSDGGGKVRSVLRVVQGADRLVRFFNAIHRNSVGRPSEFKLAQVNGEPGLLRYAGGALDTVFSFVTNGTQICEIYAVRNPDKLRLIPDSQKHLH